MVPLPGQATDRASGFVTTQFVLAVALSLVLFVMLCNAIVYQYARGVVRSALDEGVRSASRAGGTVGSCEAAAEDVRRTLLGGPVGGQVTIRCGFVDGTVRATATGYLPGWLPFVPDWTIDLAASAVREPFSSPTTTVTPAVPAPGPAAPAPGPAVPASGPAALLPLRATPFAPGATSFAPGATSFAPGAGA